jgi:putative membrane protein
VALPSFHVHVDVWVVLGSVVAAYLIAVRRHAVASGQAVDRRHRRMFVGGMAILLLASTWPMHDLAERYLYSMHMVQHMLYTLVAAPLLVAGIPAWLWRAFLRPRPVGAVWRFLTRPLVALLFFNGVLLFTHWPQIVAASVGSELTHFALHSLIVGSALVMWWPIVSPLPEMPPLTPPGQMIYLFLQSIAPTIPASFLTFGHTVLYPPYDTFPRIWGWSALEDQMIAGLIMKLVGGMILWSVIAAVFFRWSQREERSGMDALGWRDVDAEIRAELSR